MAIGSITKTFTATEVMLLVGQGRVDLDAPISDYVSRPFDPRAATVRQALSMRAGFPAFPFEQVVDAVEADLDRSWTTAEVMGVLGQGPHSGRRGQIGGPAEYNNVNFRALRALIEALEGAPCAEAIRRDLLDRVDLERIWCRNAETPEPSVSVGESSRLALVVDPHGPYLPSRAMATTAGAAGDGRSRPEPRPLGLPPYGGFVIEPGASSSR